MWNLLRDKSVWVYGTFHNNETILYARVKGMLGCLWFALAGTDLSAIINNPKYLAYWLMFDSFVSEMLRRSRAEFNHSDDHDEGSK